MESLLLTRSIGFGTSRLNYAKVVRDQADCSVALTAIAPRRSVSYNRVLAPGPQESAGVASDEEVFQVDVEDIGHSGSPQTDFLAACSPYVHRFELSSDNSARIDQLNQLQHIHRFAATENGQSKVKQQLVLDLAAGEAWGCVGRRLEAVSNPEQDSTLPAGTLVSTDWPLQWVSVFAGVSIGSGLCRPSDVRVVTQATGATTIISLQARESLECLGGSWAAIAEEAELAGVAQFRLPSSEFDEQEQASVVVEAVRLLAGLLSAGHRVHVACSTGCVGSATVALVYESVVNGLPWAEAEARLKAVFPAAQPLPGVWEQVKALLVGDKVHRLTQLAEEQYQRRLSEGAVGSSTQDWEAAQQLVMAETMEDLVARDIVISSALTQAAALQAQTARQGTPPAESSPPSAPADLSLRLSQLERKHLAAMAAARSASEQMHYFCRQAEELRLAEAEARREAEAAAQRIARLEEQLRGRQAQEEEAQGLAGRLAEAEAQVAAGLEREAQLRLSSEAAEERARAARELADELAARLQRMEGMEAAAKEAAQAAVERMEVLAGQVAALKGKEEAAQAAATEAQQRARQAEAADAASRQVVEQMRGQVERAEKETRKAREALGAANERVTFFFRIMKGLRDRERAALDAVAEANTRLAEAAAEAAQTRRREGVMREAWRLASERIELLSGQVARIEAMRVSARQVAEEAAREFLQATGNAEAAAAQQAAEAAKLREAELAEQVAALERQLAEEQEEGRRREGHAEAAQRELQEREAREQAAKTEAEAAGRRVSELTEQLAIAQAREAQAKEEAAALAEQLAQEKQQSAGEAELQRLTGQLQRQVASLGEQLAAAEASATAARDRSDFLLRQLARLKERVEAEGEAREEAQQQTVQALREEVKEVEGREQAARAEAEAAAAQVVALQAQVEELRRREAAAKAKWAAAQERIGFFSRQAEHAKERDERQRATIRSTRREVADLNEKVAALQRGLEAAAGRRREAGELVAGLGAATQEMKERFAEASSALQQVPLRDASGTAMPAWKAQMLAVLCERKQREAEERRRVREERRREAGGEEGSAGGKEDEDEGPGAAEEALVLAGAGAGGVGMLAETALRRVPPTAPLHVPPTSFASALPYAVQMLENETRALIAARQPVLDRIHGRVPAGGAPPAPLDGSTAEDLPSALPPL